MIGVKARPIVMISVGTEVPRLAITAIRKMIPGIARKASMRRLDDLVEPAAEVAEREAERACRAMIASSVAAGAMCIVLRAPAITRESTSRPSWSVPNGYLPLGLLQDVVVWKVGSCGAMR